MKKLTLLAILLIAALAGGMTAYVVSPKHEAGPAAVAKGETAYDRVIRTGTLKCGYGVWEPLFIKDPNTGAFSGIFYEYVEALGKALNLKIDWSQEVGWGDFPAALQSGRIDAMCSGVWPNAARAREMDFSLPIYFNKLNAYARSDDTRFDTSLATINNATITAAIIDGETSSVIAANDFPLAKTDQLPQMTGQTQTLLEVANHKADVTFLDSATAASYMAVNPGQVKQVPTAVPLRLFGNELALPQGEDKLRRMMDTATQDLLNNGTIERIIQKYEQYPGTLARVAKPYEGEKP